MRGGRGGVAGARAAQALRDGGEEGARDGRRGGGGRREDGPAQAGLDARAPRRAGDGAGPRSRLARRLHLHQVARRADGRAGAGETPLIIVRPAIIESSHGEPYPGWIQGSRMADPIIMAFAKGIIREFPGDPESLIDIVPVDHVVNATLAAATRRPRGARGLPGRLWGPQPSALPPALRARQGVLPPGTPCGTRGDARYSPPSGRSRPPGRGAPAQGGARRPGRRGQGGLAHAGGAHHRGPAGQDRARREARQDEPLLQPHLRPLFLGYRDLLHGPHRAGSSSPCPRRTGRSSRSTSRLSTGEPGCRGRTCRRSRRARAARSGGRRSRRSRGRWRRSSTWTARSSART